MIFRWRCIERTCTKVTKSDIQRHHVRNVTALYITGDKAKENYATLQPYMDYAKISRDKESLEYSIKKRNLQDSVNLVEISKKYDVFRNLKKRIEDLENRRDMIATKLRSLTKQSNTEEKEIEALKSQGKQLREEQRTLREALYPIEDEFAHAYLNIPNSLHPQCAIDKKEKLLYRNGVQSQLIQCKSHMERTDLIRFENNDRYYFFKDAATFDVFATQTLTRYLVQIGGFLQTANPDFVRCVLLEANATPLEQYHQVIEQQLQNQLNCAYLSGGASFESFLAAVTRLNIYPSVLPLRYVCCGRTYEKMNSSNSIFENLFTATQSNTVGTFIATETPEEADQQFEEILNLTINFYKSVGIHFRVIYEDASKLTGAESLRATIEVYSPHEQRYVCVGRISNYGDYVSKRILFCMRKKKDYHFLNLVGGPILYTTRLVAALIENRLPLKYEHLLGAFKSNIKPSATEEFKALFK